MSSLSIIMDLLLHRMKELNEDNIDLEYLKYYWNIPPENMVDISEEAVECSIGDFEDDLLELSKLLSGRTPNPLDLERLGNVLKILSHYVSI